jgi:hypoxanthine phosphoribosyltransferase
MIKKFDPSNEKWYVYYWDQYLTDLAEITDQIKQSGWTPDLIVGVARGGVFPATMLSHIMDIPVEYLYWTTRDGNKADVKKCVELIKHGKKILIVDDIVDSGRTVSEISKTMSNLSSTEKLFSEFKYAAMFHNKGQDFRTNYYANEIDRKIFVSWVKFPWESMS